MTVRNRCGGLLARLLLLGIGALTAAVLAPRPAAAEYREQVLHDFDCKRRCATPVAGLIMDGAGNLYGTTRSGGLNRQGVVFELTPNATKTEWTLTVLYPFCSRGACFDGAAPVAGLIMDGAGNLYGTTESGGFGRGVVFELTPNDTKTVWAERVLYRFCSQGGCRDGHSPVAGLIMDRAGNLYGTTRYGGANGWGVVFELTPNATKTAWTETVLYRFCSRGGACADGALPVAGLIMDRAGNLYGTTVIGGFRNAGVVFELTPNATGTTWTETVLRSFSPGDFRGANPAAPLIMDGAGNLYGTTSVGGFGSAGVVFELTPNASGTAWTETVLHSFGLDRRHGANPEAGLIMDRAGNLYGTTSVGGLGRGGVVFELTPDGAERVLYSFCQASRCADGAIPVAPMIMDGVGNLFGTTTAGGLGGGGVVFELAR